MQSAALGLGAGQDHAWGHAPSPQAQCLLTDWGSRQRLKDVLCPWVSRHHAKKCQEKVAEGYIGEKHKREIFSRKTQGQARRRPKAQAANTRRKHSLEMNPHPKQGRTMPNGNIHGVFFFSLFWSSRKYFYFIFYLPPILLRHVLLAINFLVAWLILFQMCVWWKHVAAFVCYWYLWC